MRGLPGGHDVIQPLGFEMKEMLAILDAFWWKKVIELLHASIFSIIIFVIQKLRASFSSV